MALYRIPDPTYSGAPMADVIWGGEWLEGKYYPRGSMVYKDGYLAISKVEKNDQYPIPAAVGEPFWLYNGTSPTTSILAKVLVFGTEFTNTNEAYILSDYRVYTVVGNSYRVYYSVDGVVTNINNFEGGQTGWAEFSTNETIVQAGTPLVLYVEVQEPAATPTFFQLDYNYLTPNNPGVPLDGTIQQSTKSLGILNVSKVAILGDATQLDTLAVGDVINAVGQSWSIQSITDRGTYYDFGVAPAAQGSPTGTGTWTFETVTPTPITVLVDPDYWLLDANVRSFYSLDNAPEVITQDAYGVDLKIQSVTQSDEWDAIPTSGSSAGGSNYPTYYQSVPLAGPVLITEAGGTTEIMTFSIPEPKPGKYHFTVGIIPKFLQANDTLTWRSIGSITSISDFFIKATVAGERVPFNYSFTYDLDGSPFSVTIQGETSGPGFADVEVDTADVFCQEIQGAQ